MRTYVRAVAPLAALALVIVACGGDDPEPDTTTDSSEDTDDEPEADAGDEEEPANDDGDAGDDGAEADAPADLAELAMNPTEDRNEQLYEAAIENGGEILLYVTLPPTETEAQIEGFNELYPDIEVEYYRGGSTGGMINRVLTESAAGRLEADVSWNNDHIAYILDGQGLFLDFVSAEDEAYDEGFRIVDTSYPSYINYWMFAYNTEMVEESELPKTYDDLLDERWAGDLTVATYVDWFYGLWNILGDDRADEFFTALGEQEPLTANQFTPTLLPVIQGERSLTTSTTSGVLRGRQREGAPIEGYFPEETTVARTVPISVFAEGGNPEGGLLFAEYVLSEEGQQLLSGRGRVPGHTAVDPDPISLRAENAELIDYGSFIPEESEWEQRMNEYFAAG